MSEAIETVIIGAGHAGLSASYLLKQRGREHVVLDKASQPADTWRNHRWDSFTFVTPNWTFRVPGAEYDGPEPQAFMGRDELVSRLDKLVEKNQLPVVFNTRVTAVQPQDGAGFLIRTEEKDYYARNLVVANGWFRAGKVPPYAAKIHSSILQMHSSDYRNPQSLPPGAVLVAGSAQSGSQIVEDLSLAGRKVFLATSSAPHAPRRYRGKDIFDWLLESHFADRTFQQLQIQGRSFVAPLFTGRDGGHALNLHKFYRDGVVLLGHTQDYMDGKLILSPDLKENLVKADMGQKFILKNIDDYIQRAGLDAPEEQIPELKDGYQAPEITALDLEAEHIHTIIWATGFQYDTSIFQMPVLDEFGIPDAPRGVSARYPGLYFNGFPYLPGLGSGFIAAVPETTGYLVDKMVGKPL